MTRRLLLVLLLAFPSAALAQTSTPPASTTPAPHAPAPTFPDWPNWFTNRGQIVPLWPEGKMPGHGAGQPENYNHPPKNLPIFVKDVSQPSMEIFQAPKTAGPVPAIIVCPGGGYGLLAYTVEGTDIAAWLNKLGITAIVLKYRVPQNRDGAFQDVQRAMRLVRQHAAEWGINPDKLGVFGFSAGGHLAARLSTNYQTPAYAPIDAADQLSCKPDYVLMLYPAYLSDHWVLVPELKVTSAVPPTFIAVCVPDARHVIDAEVYAKALDQASVPEELHIYPTGGHGFGLHVTKDTPWPDQAVAWLRKQGVL